MSSDDSPLVRRLITIPRLAIVGLSDGSPELAVAQDMGFIEDRCIKAELMLSRR